MPPRVRHPDARRLHLGRRALAAIALAALGVLGQPPAGVAGTYEVLSCSSGPEGGALRGVDDAWTFWSSDPSHVSSFTHCPADHGLDLDGDTYGAHGDGRVVWTELEAAGRAPRGTSAHWRFVAPPGTAVSRLQLARELGKRLNSWELFVRLADGTKLPGSDCVVGTYDYFCRLGGPSQPYEDWRLAHPTSSVRVGIACTNTTTDCDTGHTLHEAWVAIYSARVTVQDDVLPMASGVTTDLFSGGWKRGAANVRVAGASDNTGIRELRVVADERVVARLPLSCDFTRAKPCGDLPAPATLALNTRDLPDGDARIEIAAVDAAGNVVVAASGRVRTDNSAPAAPTPTTATTRTVEGSDATVGWANPAGQAAPITTAHWSVCGPATCSSGTSPIVGDGGGLPVRMEAPGTYTVRVSLSDEAGNHEPARATVWSITRALAPVRPGPQPPSGPAGPPTAAPGPSTPPAAPIAPPPGGTNTSTTPPTDAQAPQLRLTGTPTVAADGRTIGVRGRIVRGAGGRVRATVRVRIAGRTRAITRTAPVRDGRFALRLRLPSARWGRATLKVRYVSAGGRRATVTRSVPRRRG